MYPIERILTILKNVLIDLYFGIWFLWRTYREPMVDGVYRAVIVDKKVELLRVTQQYKCLKPAVIMVPGSGANAHQYRPMLQNLLDMGALFRYDVFVMNQTNLHNVYCNTDDYARDLDDKMSLIDSNYLLFVGHSYGGIIAGAYVSSLNKVYKIVTVCSPWHGVKLLSTLQTWGFLNTARHYDMRQNSEVLIKIRSRLRDDLSNWLTIGSYGDAQVPCEYALIGRAKHYESWFAHTQIITRPEITAKILQHFDNSLNIIPAIQNNNK